MKKNIAVLLTIVISSLLFLRCTDIDDSPQAGTLPIQNFIWKGLNSYYLYQENVADLSDNRFSSQKELNNFLSAFTNPEELFNSLLYQKNSTDRFSVIFSDYTALEQALSGSNDTNGAELAFSYKNGSSTDIFGWVKYIMPNSDAASKNIQRGTVFYAINGVPLTVNNYRQLIASTTYTLNLADYNNGSITPNGQTVSLTKMPYSENPVFMTNVYDLGTKKVGYLIYNGFYSNYENQLNQAFGSLKAQGITHLILDLRYNSGGSVATATRLASMITGQFTGQIFAKQQWNNKITSNSNSSNFINNFTSTISNGNAINTLQLNKIYILTTRSTASASELIINGLKPYISVVQIGKTTVGKNVGSVTLYDSPNFTKTNLNPSHRYAMQPLVLKIVNKNGFGDYANGISPDISNELAEDIGNLGVIGDPNEPYLAKALALINNGGRLSNPKEFKTPEEIIEKSPRDLKFEMYLDEFPKDVLNIP